MIELEFTPWHRRAQTAQQTSDRTIRYTPQPALKHTEDSLSTNSSRQKLNYIPICVKKNSPFAGPLSSKRMPWWGKSWLKHCNTGAHICPAPIGTAVYSIILLEVMHCTQWGSMISCSAHLGIKFLLHIRSTGCCQNIVQHYEYVSFKVEG